MAQRLRTCTDCSLQRTWVPTPKMGRLQLQVIWRPLVTSAGNCTHMSTFQHRYTCILIITKRKINLKNKFKVRQLSCVHADLQGAWGSQVSLPAGWIGVVSRERPYWPFCATGCLFYTGGNFLKFNLITSNPLFFICESTMVRGLISYGDSVKYLVDWTLIQ